MKIKSTTLIEELVQTTRDNIERVERLNQLQFDELNSKPNKDCWSKLECIEHLNIYGNYYLPELKKRIKESSKIADQEFKSGKLGNYFVKIIMPKENLKIMKTLKENDPSGSELDKSTISEFIAQQKAILQILESAKKVSLRKTKTSISISKLIKLRLGDTLRFVVYHNLRHIIQAER